jgi:hypothetical protein
LNLLGLILRRDRDENGFVKAAAYQFDLPPRSQFLKVPEKLRVALLAPFEQRSAVMQTQANARMPKQTLDEWQVRALVGVLQYSIEIADWLMSMDKEDEIKLGQLTTPYNVA